MAGRTRRRRGHRAAAGATLAVLALTGCVPNAESGTPGSSSTSTTTEGTPAGEDTGEPRQGGEIVIARGEKHEGWNPDAANGFSTIQSIQTVIEPLLRYNPDGESIDPGIASDWTFDADAPSYTFTLDDAAAFSDGTPVTCADVAFSVDQWKAGPNYGPVYGVIDAVTCPDEGTVVFELSAPDTTLPVLLTWQSAAVMPEDFGGRSADEYFADPVGAGAFVVESWTPGSELVLEPNEHYYRDGQPYVDRITILETDDPSQRTVSYEAGNVDIVDFVPPTVVGQYPEDELVLADDHLLLYAGLNTRQPPFDDPDVRRAVAHAVDYEAMVGILEGTGSTPDGGLPQNVSNWAAPSEAWYETDLDAAQQAMDDSGHPDGATVELIYDASIGTEQLTAQVVQQSLGEIGITVDIVGLETSGFLEKMYGGDFGMALWNMGAISPDVIDPIGFYLVTEYLYTGYDTATLAENYTAYTVAESDEEKQEIVQAVQDEIRTELPFVPLADNQVVAAVAPEVGGYEIAPWGTYWLDELWLR